MSVENSLGAETGPFENTLERLLGEAVASEAARPYFYKELLQSSVYISPHEPLSESATSPDSYTLKLASMVHDGVNYIPFYTAPRHIPRGVRCIQVPAKTFFQIIKGSHAVLNPGSPPVKLFPPAEIERLVSGQLLSPEKQFDVKSSERVIISEPPAVPSALIKQLSKHFVANENVLRAWLGWYHNPRLEKEPGYMLAVETVKRTDFKELAGMISAVLRDVGTGGLYCDIVQYTGSGITRHFSGQKPFYAVPLFRRVAHSLF